MGREIIQAAKEIIARWVQVNVGMGRREGGSIWFTLLGLEIVEIFLMRVIQEEEGGDSDRGERGEEGVAGIEIANGADGRDVAEARPTPEKKMIVNNFL